MRRHALNWYIFLLCLGLVPCGTACSGPASAAEPAARPRLVVLVVFDQLRGDFIERWAPHFGKGGFRRLQTEGAWFQNCHYPYAATLTGAGHASLMAGCSPRTHGVVANEWYDRGLGKSLNCVWSLKHERVPMVSGATTGKVAPDTLRAESFGDVLKEATGGEGKIVALSFKDRSAVLPGGHHADACYWFESSTGNFITSTYYTDQIHPWVDEFNRARMIDTWFGTDWNRFRPELDYDAIVGPDDVKGEGGGSKQGRTFPHPTTGGLDKPGTAYYDAVYASPFGNQLLLDLARKALESEELGQDEIPDLFTVSFSSNDAVGHAWGPDSQEVFDMTLRSDAILSELLELLDRRVGRGRYLLALSADHGVCPIPEVAKARGLDAGRVPSTALRKDIELFLDGKFGVTEGQKATWIQTLTNSWIFLNPVRMKDRNVTYEEVESALAEWLQQQHGIHTAIPRSRLPAGIAETDVIGQQVARSYAPDRCGDILLILKPNWLLGDQTSGTTHGSPFPYDTHVPLLIYGTGVSPGVHSTRVSPTAIGPILSQGLNYRAPKASDTPVPNRVFNAVIDQ